MRRGIPQQHAPPPPSLPPSPPPWCSVAEMAAQEATTTGRGMAEALARNITGRGAGGRAALRALGGAGGEDEYAGGLDDAAAAARPRRGGLTAQEQQKRDMAAAIAADRAWGAATASCSLCLDSESLARDCIIATGEHCLLALPPDGSRIPGHVVLAPLSHVASVREADEDTYDELNRWKAALHGMYAAEGEDVLFLETAVHLGARRRHARIDVVPMDKEIAFDAPLFFRKAMTEAEEWTTNRQLVDTAGKGLRGSIPVGFPYLHVGWRGGGFVHPIDDDVSFPVGFGLDVCAGMMGLPPSAFDRAGKGVGTKHRDPVAVRAAAADLRKRWAAAGGSAGVGGGGK
jgi:hypothetical protein